MSGSMFIVILVEILGNVGIRNGDGISGCDAPEKSLSNDVDDGTGEKVGEGVGVCIF